METDFDKIKNANNNTDETIPLNKISVKSLKLVDNQNSKDQVFFYSFHFIIFFCDSKYMHLK